MAKEKKQRKDEAGELEAQNAEYLAGWKKALADYDNLKKDLARERQQIRRQSTEDLLHLLIPVLDNFEQATKYKPEHLDPATENWLSGILFIRQQFEDVMKQMGAEAFGAAGETFDPALHEAAQERDEDGKKDQEILEVLQSGWRIGEKIIRPAKVVVNVKR